MRASTMSKFTSMRTADSNYRLVDDIIDHQYGSIFMGNFRNLQARAHMRQDHLKISFKIERKDCARCGFK